MSLVYGNNNIGNIFYGDKAIDRIYWNSEAVYKRAKDMIYSFQKTVGDNPTEFYLMNQNLETVKTDINNFNQYNDICGFDIDNNFYIPVKGNNATTCRVFKYDDKGNEIGYVDINIKDVDTDIQISDVFYHEDRGEFLIAGEAKSKSKYFLASASLNGYYKETLYEIPKYGGNPFFYGSQLMEGKFVTFTSSYKRITLSVYNINNELINSWYVDSGQDNYNLRYSYMGNDTIVTSYDILVDGKTTRRLDKRRLSDLSLIASNDIDFFKSPDILKCIPRDNTIMVSYQNKYTGNYSHVWLIALDYNLNHLWTVSFSNNDSSKTSYGIDIFDDESNNKYLFERNYGSSYGDLNVYKVDKNGELLEKKCLISSTYNISERYIPKASYYPIQSFYNKYWK